MFSTRQRILDYLGQHGSATARQLAQAFGMTAANLRHHLDILVSRRLITTAATKSSGRRGRPQQSFILSPAAQPDNLTQLSAGLLSQTKGRGQDSKMKVLASKLLGEGVTLAGNPTQRLLGAVKKLSPMGYQPHWEARPSAPQVVLGHCPYASIIADHPELCRMDAHLLEQLLGSQVEQIAKLQPGPQGTPQCIFQVNK